MKMNSPLRLVAFLDHNWNKRFSTAIGYSMLDIDNSNGQAPNAFRRGHYGFGNLLFYPTENSMVGGEFQWEEKRTSSMVSSRTIFASSFPLGDSVSKTFTL